MLDFLLSVVFAAWFFICIPLLILGFIIWTTRGLVREFSGLAVSTSSTRTPTLDELINDYDLTEEDKKEIKSDENFQEIYSCVMYEMWRNGGVRRTSFTDVFKIFKYMYECRRGVNGISDKLLDKFASQFADRYCSHRDRPNQVENSRREL